MNKELIVEALNKDRADELAVVMQYMEHHYMMQGPESLAVSDVEKDIAMQEMKHAEMLAERITYLGGEPTTSPSPIKRGGDMKRMVQDDLDSENTAIENYRQHIKLCEREEDYTTKLMLESILSQEEEHAGQFETVLGTRSMVGMMV